MYRSAAVKRGKRTSELLWLVLVTAAGFVLAGWFARDASPRHTVADKKLEFAAREYYDR
jgi:hypothetical protein